MGEVKNHLKKLKGDFGDGSKITQKNKMQEKILAN